MWCQNSVLREDRRVAVSATTPPRTVTAVPSKMMGPSLVASPHLGSPGNGNLQKNIQIPHKYTVHIYIYKCIFVTACFIFSNWMSISYWHNSWFHSCLEKWPNCQTMLQRYIIYTYDHMHIYIYMCMYNLHFYIRITYHHIILHVSSHIYICEYVCPPGASILQPCNCSFILTQEGVVPMGAVPQASSLATWLEPKDGQGNPRNVSAFVFACCIKIGIHFLGTLGPWLTELEPRVRWTRSPAN